MAGVRRVFLVGPMGAGKTTIGRLLAQHLDLDFLDSDQEVEVRTGADIPWIFDVEGESGFRDREQRVIDELTQRDGIVLATGGGAVLRESNREALSGRGEVVYLHTSLQQQLKRTGNDRNRPLLQVEDPESRLRELMAERDPLYRQVADHVIDTDGLTAREVARNLSQILSN
jgi:shikimate kinase